MRSAVALVPQDEVYQKSISNVEEIKARVKAAAAASGDEVNDILYKT